MIAIDALEAFLNTPESGLGQVNIMPKTAAPDHYQVSFTMNGGCTPPQGHFRSREEAKKWAGKRPCWVMFTPLMGEKIRWTVKKK